MIKQIRITIFIFLFLIPAWGLSDSLMIIASANHRLGKISAFSEESVGSFIKSMLKKKYSKIYIWKEGAEKNNPTDLLQKIVDEKESEDRLDVISIQHGPAPTFIPFATAETVETILPYGFVRRLYSSACGQWGYFSSRLDGSEFKVDHYNNFINHISKLGLEEYIIHANNNPSWLLFIPIFVKTLRASGQESWIKSGINAYIQYEKIASNLSFMKELVPEKLKYHAVALALNPNSRPVFGSKDQSLIEGYKNIALKMFQPSPEYSEFILAPGERIKSKISEITSDFVGDYFRE